MWGCDVWVAHTHMDPKPVARHQKLRRYLYNACSFLEPILQQAQNHIKDLTLHHPPSPPQPYRQRTLTPSAAALTSAEFTGSYNQGQQKPTDENGQPIASRSLQKRWRHVQAITAPTYPVPSPDFPSEDSCCCLWISGLPLSLWHKWKVITISEIKTLGSDTTFSITQTGC